MATPNYVGQGQPSAPSGGWLSGLFGSSTPAYLGASSTAAGAAPRASFFSIAPTYKAATNESDAQATPAQIAIVIPRQMIDPQT